MNRMRPLSMPSLVMTHMMPKSSMKSRENFDCLNEFTEVIHNDELELQSSKGEPLASTENHEVFTHNDRHGKNLNLYISLTLSLQTDEETWSISSVRRYSPKSEYEFTYMMLMHRKRVRL